MTKLESIKEENPNISTFKFYASVSKTSRMQRMQCGMGQTESFFFVLDESSSCAYFGNPNSLNQVLKMDDYFQLAQAYVVGEDFYENHELRVEFNHLDPIEFMIYSHRLPK